MDLNINDGLSAIAAIAATLIAVRQKLRDEAVKEKDEQIKSRDDTIVFLKQQIAYLRDDQLQAIKPSQKESV